MIIRANTNFSGALDLSSSERLGEDNVLEKCPFRLSVKPGQTVNVDDKWYYLRNIQSALKQGYIQISGYKEQTTFSQEITTPESHTTNYNLTKVAIWNRSDYPQDAFRKYNVNMDLIDTFIGGAVSKFIQLTDVPNSYSGGAGRGIRVKPDESGLEFGIPVHYCIVYVQKNPDNGAFTTIYEALASISDASATKPYVISIGPGIYTEPLLTVGSYISLRGENQQTVIIEPDASNHDVIKMSNMSSLYYLTVQGAGTGFSAINCTNVGDWVTIHKVTAQLSYTGFLIQSTSIDSYVYMEYCDFQSCTYNGLRITDTGFVALCNNENFYFQQYITDPVTCVSIDGQNSECNIQVCTAVGSGSLTETAFAIRNGGYLNICSAKIEDFNKAIYVQSSGTDPYLKCQAIDFDDNNLDIVVENPTCTGFYNGDYKKDKFQIDPAAPFYISNINPVVITVSSKGAQFSNISDAISSITDASATKVYIIQLGPESFTEPELTIPPYVYLKGDQQEATKIYPDSANHNVINLSINSGIYNLQVYDAGSGYCGISYVDQGSWAILHKVSIYNCDIGLLIYATTEYNDIYLETVDFEYCISNCMKIINTGSGKNSVICTGLFFTFVGTSEIDGVLVDGSESSCQIQNLQCFGEGAYVENAFRVTNGGQLNVTSGFAEYFNRVFYVDSTGSASLLRVQGMAFNENNYHCVVNSTSATGSYLGEYDPTKFIINSSCSWYVANVDAQIITVAKKGGQYTSVKAAVDSITDSSTTKRYVISVGPGIFTEDTITMKPYVYISGTSSKSSTIIELNLSNPLNNYLIETSVNCNITNCLLRNATGSGKALIKYHGSDFRLIDCIFGDCETAIDAENISTAFSEIWVTRAILASSSTIVDFMKVSDNGTGSVMALLEGVNFFNAIAITNALTIHGNNTGVLVMNSMLRPSTGIATGYGIRIYNGAILRVLSSTICDYDISLYVENTGSAPNLTISSCIFTLNTTADIKVDHPGTVGIISAQCDAQKVTCASTTLGLQISDVDDGSFRIAGDLFFGNNWSNVTNYTPILQKGQMTGAISGGSLSVSSGLTIQAAAGTGYMIVGSSPNNYSQYTTWTTQTKALTANSDNYIYIDNSGILQSSTSLPDIFKTIILAKARTDSVNVLFFQDIPTEVESIAVKLERTLRLGFGPIYVTGSEVSENSTALNLDVGSGRYYYGTHEYLPSGGTGITWTYWYRNGSGGWTTGNQTAVDNAYYDNNGVSLTAIPVNDYAKHVLYIANDGTHETYQLVYAQATYANLIDVQNAGLPNPPGTWTSNITKIASIIVRQGASNIVQVRDERSRLSFVASAGSVITRHGDLSGLPNDDHSQYLLVNGTRSMSGGLNMGTGNITNVGTVDGVTVSSHQSRHLPNGLDPLTTAAPSGSISTSSSNSVGIANSLARSDHMHALSLPSAAYFVIDGNGSNIKIGDKTYIKIPFNGTITSWEVTADQTGTCVMAIKKSTYASFPTFTTISGTTPPALTSQSKAQGNVSGWTSTTLSAGDYLQISVISIDQLTKISVSLPITRT